jgi:hypothetical protein
MINISALLLLGKTLELEGEFVYGGCHGVTALQPSRCRTVTLTRFASSNLSICGSGKMDGRLCQISVFFEDFHKNQ